MRQAGQITAPFFEIGPKSYIYGDKILELAKIADAASKKYQIDVIFTTPYTEIRSVVSHTENIFVSAPHIDPLYPGRGLADILPEAVKAAGAMAVMLNHVEKPLTYSSLAKTIRRANETGLKTIVCAGSLAETFAVAQLKPDVIVSEPEELIGGIQRCSNHYIAECVQTTRGISPHTKVLIAAGISGRDDVYNTIFAGADATGSSSGIMNAPDPEKMVYEMLEAARCAWNDRHKK